MWRYLRFRYRRAVRRTRRNIRILRLWSRSYIERHIWGKWYQLRVVRRFLLLWWLIAAIAFIGLLQQIGVLNQLASIVVAKSGGTYVEAEVGTVTTLNPVLPEPGPSADIDQLIFSGLTRYDSQGKVVPDLATSWTVSPDGTTYTFHLRHNVKWQDGVPFNSSDVAFTITAIQNPDSRSPLASSWQGVTFATPNNYTIVFTLPEPLSSFIDSTTVGIIPSHLLASIDPSSLADADFNQHPIGTGPFEMKTFAPSAGDIELAANPNYYLGRPRLDGFDFKFFSSSQAALTAYAQHQVTSPGQITPVDTLIARQQPDLTEYNFTLPDETTLFFNTQDQVLSDGSLRLILSRALNRQAILDHATGDVGSVVEQPLLPSQLGYTTKYQPSQLTAKAARAALTAAGWTQSHAASIRTKDGHSLKFQLVTLQANELVQAANEIKRQYALLGVDVQVKAVGADQLQQTYMRPRNFQMLLYGLNVGADPDVYAYWHSSQAKDPGVNLSQYNSTDADHALEAGRIKTDRNLRADKYHEFLQAWDGDAPAAVLYQAGYIYATSSSVDGIEAHHLITPPDRFYDVQRWTALRRFSPNY